MEEQLRGSFPSFPATLDPNFLSRGPKEVCSDAVEGNKGVEAGQEPGAGMGQQMEYIVCRGTSIKSSSKVAHS